MKSNRCFFAVYFLLSFANACIATEFYVAPTGKDSDSGTEGAPFASLSRAQKAVAPGDTVYIRGGTYKLPETQVAEIRSIWAYIFKFDKSGESGKPIKYWNYPGEKPVFDCSAVKPAGKRVTAFHVLGSWLHFKGIEVVGVQVTILTHTQSECFDNRGNNNIYEQLSMHDGQAIGFWLGHGSNNLILNCDAYNNWDNTSENKRGGNVDGFGFHAPKGSDNNVFRGCRAWFNSDDGFDFISSGASVTVDHCWAFYNGYGQKFENLGDGNGFKAGGYGSTPVEHLPNPIPRHVIQNCVAVRNKASGFYANHHLCGDDWLNNTAFKNGHNFNMLCRKQDNSTEVPGYGHKMKNNLGYKGKTEVTNLDYNSGDLTGNYFNLPVKVTDKDFQSLDEAELTGPRQANGDLPEIKFLHLTPNSELIDKGVDIGLRYAGKAPDLGAFETGMVKEAAPKSDAK